MKIALVHDWLTTIAGAEKVLKAIYEIYPNSDIFTLVKNEDNLKNTLLENANIKTSFIQKLPFAKTKYRNYLPFFPLAIEQFDVSDYDIVISSSHAVAKGILTNANQLHISYVHTPIRYAWDLYAHYLKEANLDKSLKGWIARYFLHKIRIWDYTTANRPDYYIANSKYIARRIKKVYNKEAEVIYPPVNVEDFELYTKKEDFYFTASRMVPYKKIDLIVEAFSKMPDKKLVVIGTGPDFEKIKSKATSNIELLGYQPFNVLKDYMKRAKAFVFAAEEDFGIIPVEAQACGTPVIAYGKGGVTETVIENNTGLFFKEQSVDSLIKAINEFEKKEDKFDFYEIRKNAERFSKQRFQKEINDFVNKKIEEFF